MEPAINRSLAVTTDRPADLPGYEVIRPTDLSATGAPLPVVVWANGGCVRYNRVWRPLLERWAAAGLFVVSIAGNEDGTPGTGPSTAADQVAAVDWAVRQHTRLGGPYKGRLDLDRIAAAGNSCGGITTIGATAADDRIRAAFVLSGSGSLPGSSPEQAAAVMGAVTIPVAYVVGGPEDIARANAEQDFDVLPADVPAYVARRAVGAHQTVSTDAGILVDEVAGIGINWLDLVFHGSPAARDALVLDPCPGCAPDLWSVREKHLDQLVRAPDRKPRAHA